VTVLLSRVGLPTISELIPGRVARSGGGGVRDTHTHKKRKISVMHLTVGLKRSLSRWLYS
jgi:hypothetical protein